MMQGCQGFAPRYSTSQKGHLRQALFAARHILLDCFGKLEDSRTGQDLIPWMLQVSLFFFFLSLPFSTGQDLTHSSSLPLSSSVYPSSALGRTSSMDAECDMLMHCLSSICCPCCLIFCFYLPIL